MKTNGAHTQALALGLMTAVLVCGGIFYVAGPPIGFAVLSTALLVAFIVAIVRRYGRR